MKSVIISNLFMPEVYLNKKNKKNFNLAASSSAVASLEVTSKNQEIIIRKIMKSKDVIQWNKPKDIFYRITAPRPTLI